MSNPSGPDDAYWRRPSGGPPPPGSTGRPAGVDDPGPPAAGPSAGAQWYAGPPRTDAPPRGWRTPEVYQPEPPRPMPVQDHDRLDAEEQSARTLTYGVGMVVGAVLLLLLCLVCVRGLL